MEIKNLWALSVFAISYALQTIYPHQNILKNHRKNMLSNLALGVINIFFLYIVYGGTLYMAAELSRNSWGGLYQLLHLPIILQVIFTLFIFDFLSFILHKTYHEVPSLWHLHAAHHSDNVFETTTSLRFHPLEVLISYAVRIIISYILGLPFIAYVIYEAIFQFFNFTQHSDFNLNKQWENQLSQIIITPAVHRRHHSLTTSDLNSNFSTIFVIWDKLFKTWNHPEPEEKIKVGCPDDDKMQTIPDLILYPVQKFFKLD